MADTIASMKLSIEGAMKIVHAAMEKARDMNVPQCISVVDAGGHLLAFARMDGAFTQSVDTALMKAMTAASYGVPTGDIAAGIDIPEDSGFRTVFYATKPVDDAYYDLIRDICKKTEAEQCQG